MNFNKPLKLISARAWRTYIGGSQIDAIHGNTDSIDSQFPEEWIMSTVVARNSGREEFINEGLSFVEGRGIALRDLISENPDKALGQKHHGKIGESTGVLVKIIDAGERLTIQSHPDKETAMRLFGSRFGKTECWHILGGRIINGEKPCIYMGFRPGVTREYWQKLFDDQNIPAMLDCLHRFEVKPGDTFIIHGGVPHAIGAGCLLIEIQEPTDYTVRTERITPSGLHISDFMCHQGLGFEKMFDCFYYGGAEKRTALEKWLVSRKTIEETGAYKRYGIIGYGETSCFRLERFDIRGECDISESEVFSGLYVFSGKGTLVCDGEEKGITAGDQFFVPASSCGFTLRAVCEGELSVFRCYGPAVE